MDIKIILPTSYGYKNRLNKAKKAIIPNLGIRYLAGMVPAEHSVSVVEEVIEDIEEKEDLENSDVCFSITRTGLFRESDGSLQTPFGVGAGEGLDK